MRFWHVGCNVDVMRWSACLVVGLVAVNSFAVLFSCMLIGQGLDFMIVPTKS